MNAPSVERSVTTPRTPSTPTAPGVTSQPRQRIDAYIRQFSAASMSDDFSSLRSTAQAVKKHGFVNSANSRYVEFLEAFRDSQLRYNATLEEHYPSCCFLNWKAFHALRRVLDLWCDLPAFYAGAVPDAQVPHLDIFELWAEDAFGLSDVMPMLETSSPYALALWGVGAGQWHEVEEYTAQHYRKLDISPHLLLAQQSGNRDKLRQWYREISGSFFVLAPKEAFTSDQDWLERSRRMVAAQIRQTVAPDDPLVIRFCRDGCLVVAAWGDEAAELNQAVNQLKL